MNNKKIFAFLGSYADLNNSGLYSCSYDAQNGSIKLLDQVEGLQNPTFLAVDANNSKLYALSVGVDSNNQLGGAATAYDIDPSTGKLSFINREMTVPAPTCHITLDHTNQCLLVSSYQGGMIGLSPLLEDGRIRSIADIKKHKGNSMLPIQDRPRAHSIFVDRSNRYIGVCDLGLDRILMYKLDLQNYSLIPHSEVRITPGSGPRHFALHPSLSYGYVINELNATITAFSYDEDKGKLNEIQTISTLPGAYDGENACADIHISPDGKFLYGSNRGHDSIAAYSINQISGTLTLVEHTSTLGGHPRNFAISPDGHFLLVANRDSNNVVTFARNVHTGKLLPNGQSFKVSMPVCIKFAALS